MANPLKDFVVPYSKGQAIFKDQEPGSEMYIIQSGSVELSRTYRGEKRFTRVLEKGDFFGEMSLLEGLPRTASAIALEDSELIVINGAVFDQMIKSNIEIAVRMLRKLSMRLRETTEQFDSLLAKEGSDPLLRPGLDESPPLASVKPQEEPPEEAEKPPVLAQFIAEESLKVFPIYKEITLIGRQDPVTGITPDIDLTSEDVKRSVSRRHAKLIYSNGTFYLAEEVGTLNGTYINGKRIPTGILTPMKSGAQVGFGMLHLKFVEATQPKECSQTALQQEKAMDC